MLIQNSDNRGFGPAVNQGLVHAPGRHLLLLNSDTVVHGDVLARTVQYLDEHADVGALGCTVRDEHGHLQPTCFREPSVLNAALQLTGLSKLEQPWVGRERLAGWARDDERDVEVVTGCYLAVPRRVVEDVGLLDEAYLFYGEETDWCRRMRQAGWRVRFAPIGEIVHVGGASAERLDHYREILLAAAKVRFVAKHHGRLAGWAEFGLLWAVALSRVLGWTTVAGLRRTQAAVADVTTSCGSGAASARCGRRCVAASCHWRQAPPSPKADELAGSPPSGFGPASQRPPAPRPWTQCAAGGSGGRSDRDSVTTRHSRACTCRRPTCRRAATPAVDAHAHLGRWLTQGEWAVPDVGALLELMDQFNIATVVNLDGRWDDEPKPTSTATTALTRAAS